MIKFEDTGIAKKLEDALYWAEIICQENSDYLELRGFNTKVLRDKFQEAKELIR